MVGPVFDLMFVAAPTGTRGLLAKQVNKKWCMSKEEGRSPTVEFLKSVGICYLHFNTNTILHDLYIFQVNRFKKEKK